MKFNVRMAVAVVLAAVAAGAASAYDWKDLLKNAAQGAGQSSTEEVADAKSSDDKSSGSSILSGLASFIGDATGLNKLKAADLVGTWDYKAPAVAFQSENLLNKAGGAAAATVIIEKITPYYQQFGLDKVSYEFKEDGTMSMSLKRLTLSGVYSINEDGTFTFDIRIKGRSIKKLQAYVTRHMKNICVTFDASGIISLMNTVAQFTGNSTAKGLAALLNSYDGLTVGFELSRR